MDLTEGMAGAVATMLLCDNGARVIRIESQGSELKRREPAYGVWDRGKESIFLDLSRALGEQGSAGSPDAGLSNTPRELSDFHSLVRKSDVLVETFSPSSTYQTLVDYETLEPINPSLVHCSITAYGKEGPLRDHPAMHDLVMARTGILAGQPTFRPGPSHLIHPVPSLGAAMLAAQGIVAALYAREKTGRGRQVETSLLAGAVLYAPKVVGEKLKAREYGSVTVGGGPFYSVLECADGEWLHLGCLHAGFVQRAVEVMGIADVLADPKFGDGIQIDSDVVRKELLGIVASIIKTKPCHEWTALLEEADVPCARACTAEEAMENPQVRFNDMVIELQDPQLGAVSQMGIPIKLSETPGRVRGPRPEPGQHTEKVLSELSEGQPRKSYAPASASGTLDPPLKGVKVLGAANVIAGPTAARLLSGLGAEIIKLEAAAGDISRVANVPYFYVLNANARCISANTRTDEGKEIAGRMAAEADVLLANMRPGATDRMGLGTEALKELNPGIIEAHVTAYGWSGPYAHRPGVDPLAQAIIGLERAQGGPQNPPVMVRLAPTDYTAGGLGALGVVMALFVRERTGLAQKVDTNLLNAGILLSSEGFMRYQGGSSRRFADKEHYGLSALHRLYETEDGWLYLIVEADEEWLALCSALDRDDLSGDERFASAQARRENNVALASQLAHTFKSGDAESWLSQLEANGVPCAPIAEESDQVFFSDPQVIATDMIIEHQHPAVGRLKLTQNEIRFGNTAPISAGAAPLLGQHTEEVLQELDYSTHQIEELYRKGLVKTEAPPTES